MRRGLLGAVAALALSLQGCVLFPTGVFEVYDPAKLASFRAEPRISGRARSTPVDDCVRIECEGFLDVAEPQQAEDLCWAACAVSVGRYLQLAQPDQAELAENVFNILGERSAEQTQIMLAICPEHMEPFRQQHRISLQVRPAGSDDLVAAIARGSPVLVGLENPPPLEGGHVYVAYAVTCARRKPVPILGPLLSADLRKLLGINDWMIKELELFDPDPFGGPVTMDAAAVKERLTFYFDRELAERRLVDAMTNAPQEIKLFDESFGFAAGR